MFLSRNRTSFFRPRIDRCRCLDRSRAKFAIPKERLHGIHCNFFIFSAVLRFGSSFPHFSVPFHFTVSPQSSLRPPPFFHSFSLPFLLPFLLLSLSIFFFFSFRFFPSPSSRDKFECALDTREKLGRFDRSRCSKTVENSLAFALYLHNKIDASRFSGPEQFS